MSTKIEWVQNPDGTRGVSWNPISGCNKISPGCQYCYAARMAQRLKGRCGYPTDNPFQVTFHPDRLDKPLHWKKPRTIFVCSMGDLFHGDVKQEWIDAVFDIIQRCPQHIFQILTKRAERMARILFLFYKDLPQNIWLGTTVESPEYLSRIIWLKMCHASTVFVSVEPFLIPFSQKQIQHYFQKAYLDWCIVGAESGPHARPMSEEWVIPILHQCQAQGIPFFYKQHMMNGKKVSLPVLEGRQWAQMPVIKT